MRENGTLRLRYATASQTGSMRVAEGRAGVLDNKGRSAPSYRRMLGRLGCRNGAEGLMVW